MKMMQKYYRKKSTAKMHRRIGEYVTPRKYGKKKVYVCKKRKWGNENGILQKKEKKIEINHNHVFFFI